MNGLAEVIPIASRRSRKPAPGRPTATAVPVTSTRRKRVMAICGGLLALLVGLTIADRALMSHPPALPAASLPQPVRQGLYDRALSDVLASCGLPEAKNGLLRGHCLDQARFLQTMPECAAEGECLRLTNAVFNLR
jgi:hypothetical protein